GVLAMLAQGGFAAGALAAGQLARRVAAPRLLALGAGLVAAAAAATPLCRGAAGTRPRPADRRPRARAREPRGGDARDRRRPGRGADDGDGRVPGDLGRRDRRRAAARRLGGRRLGPPGRLSRRGAGVGPRRRPRDPPRAPAGLSAARASPHRSISQAPRGTWPRSTSQGPGGGWWPGGRSGNQMRQDPGGGRWPGGTWGAAAGAAPRGPGTYTGGGPGSATMQPPMPIATSRAHRPGVRRPVAARRAAMTRRDGGAVGMGPSVTSVAGRARPAARSRGGSGRGPSPGWRGPGSSPARAPGRGRRGRS